MTAKTFCVTSNAVNAKKFGHLMGKECLKCIFLFIIIFSWAQKANSASFDCTRSATYVERLICTHLELSTMDEDLSRLYRKAKENLAGTPNEYKILEAQRDWLRARNKCTTVACLSESYSSQLTYLAEAASFSAGGQIVTDRGTINQNEASTLPRQPALKPLTVEPSTEVEGLEEAANSHQDITGQSALERFAAQHAAETSVVDKSDIEQTTANHSSTVPYDPGPPSASVSQDPVGTPAKPTTKKGEGSVTDVLWIVGFLAFLGWLFPNVFKNMGSQIPGVLKNMGTQNSGGTEVQLRVAKRFAPDFKVQVLYQHSASFQQRGAFYNEVDAINAAHREWQGKSVKAVRVVDKQGSTIYSL